MPVVPKSDINFTEFNLLFGTKLYIGYFFQRRNNLTLEFFRNMDLKIFDFYG
jgi:hypothetical protein